VTSSEFKPAFHSPSFARAAARPITMASFFATTRILCGVFGHQAQEPLDDVAVLRSENAALRKQLVALERQLNNNGHSSADASTVPVPPPLPPTFELSGMLPTSPGQVAVEAAKQRAFSVGENSSASIAAKPKSFVTDETLRSARLRQTDLPRTPGGTPTRKKTVHVDTKDMQGIISHALRSRIVMTQSPQSPQLHEDNVQSH
jgi:hypothetical protein